MLGFSSGNYWPHTHEHDDLLVSWEQLLNKNWGPLAAAQQALTDEVTQRQAKHWNQGDTGNCPFCKGEEEDETHRWFRCPAWSQARAAAGFLTPALALEQQLPKAMAIWGLPVLPPAVADWRDHNLNRMLQIPRRPSIEETQIVCVDGSGLFPKDTILRTVAWAIAWHDGLLWHTKTGQVPGHQTVPRSEACAILMAIADRHANASHSLE